MGTTTDPFFCGRDVCELLGYKDIKQALRDKVDSEDKMYLNDLVEVHRSDQSTSVVLGKHENLSYNEGRTVYISINGLKHLLQRNTVAKPSTMRAIIEHPFMVQLKFDLNLIQENLIVSKTKTTTTQPLL
jgi:hypothetical protein